MGPLRALLRWGATVAAVDLPRPALWERLRRTARAGCGPAAAAGRRTDRPGADLLTEVPALADWLAGLPGRPVLGHYAYADGGLHVRLSAAADVLAQRLARQRADLGLAFLATPTDTFAVPGTAVAAGHRRVRAVPGIRRIAGRSVTSGGRLLQPQLRARGGPGDQRQPDPAAGPELRAGQADPALAGGRGPGRRDDGLLPRRPVHPDPFA